jgi:hypothetical protein
VSWDPISFCQYTLHNEYWWSNQLFMNHLSQFFLAQIDMLTYFWIIQRKKVGAVAADDFPLPTNPWGLLPAMELRGQNGFRRQFPLPWKTRRTKFRPPRGLGGQTTAEHQGRLLKTTHLHEKNRFHFLIARLTMIKLCTLKLRKDPQPTSNEMYYLSNMHKLVKFL